MAKINVRGIPPPDHPIWKEGWSISTGPFKPATPPKPQVVAKKPKSKK